MSKKPAVAKKVAKAEKPAPKPKETKPVTKPAAVDTKPEVHTDVSFTTSTGATVSFDAKHHHGKVEPKNDLGPAVQIPGFAGHFHEGELKDGKPQ